RKARYLTLSMQEAEVAEVCVTRQGISVNIRAVIAFKVGNDDESIVNAGQRFLSDQDQMGTLTGRIFAGHLRSIVGSMTVAAVVQAQYKAEVDQAQAQSSQMGPLTQAKAQMDVLAAQTELAHRQAELRQRQLVAEVIKPAEAEADKVRILAQAEAERMRIQAA